MKPNSLRLSPPGSPEVTFRCTVLHLGVPTSRLQNQCFTRKGHFSLSKHRRDQNSAEDVRPHSHWRARPGSHCTRHDGVPRKVRTGSHGVRMLRRCERAQHRRRSTTSFFAWSCLEPNPQVVNGICIESVRWRMADRLKLAVQQCSLRQTLDTSNTASCVQIIAHGPAHGRKP